jgi:hypothetical protein
MSVESVEKVFLANSERRSNHTERQRKKNSPICARWRRIFPTLCRCRIEATRTSLPRRAKAYGSTIRSTMYAHDSAPLFRDLPGEPDRPNPLSPTAENGWSFERKDASIGRHVINLASMFFLRARQDLLRHYVVAMMAVQMTREVPCRVCVD